MAALIIGLGDTLLQLFGSTSDADAGSSGDSGTEGDAHLSSGPLWSVLLLRFWISSINYVSAVVPVPDSHSRKSPPGESSAISGCACRRN